jgi:uncharacterized protein
MDDSEQPHDTTAPVKPLKSRLLRASRAAGVPQDVVEKDYALSYVLAGLYSHEWLKTRLLLKGGTALKKLYFGEYRFSEDLDFSTGATDLGQPLDEAVREASETAGGLLSRFGPFESSCERYEEREPHPRSQQAFVIRLRFPWQREALCRVKLEVTTDEPVLLEPEARRLIHGYEEHLNCTVRCYALEEIVAEKLRTLLQTHRKLATRGWNRPRARDYYDLWRVFGEYGDTLRGHVIPAILREKSAHRDVQWNCVDDFFTGELTREAIRTWDDSLGPFVSELPQCTTVLSQLRNTLAQVLQESP